MRKSTSSILAGLALAGAPAAFASDGVLEINQACALAGCFSGDTPSFPVTIDGSAGASYLLTGSLSVPNENTSAIQITIDGISVDLNGFSIRGITTCGFIPYAVCAPVGTGNGISGSSNTSVRNGTVIGMGGYGLDLGFDGVVENVRVLNSGLGGIRLGGGSAARAVTANGNNGFGVKVDFRGAVFSSIATNNSGNAVELGDGAIVRDTVVHSNGQNGIVCFSDCLATANEITSNGLAGLVGPALPNCEFNGTLAYGGNVISRNAGGAVGGCAAQVGINLCNGSAATCP